MTGDGVSQSRNQVGPGGQLAAGSINNTNLTQNIFEAQRRTSVILDYIEQLKAEIEGNTTTTQMLEDLEYYTKPRPTTLSLEEKLAAAGRSDELPKAIEYKEIFVKRVTLFQLHNSAQHLFAICLGFAHAHYQAKVEPLIQAGANRNDVDLTIINEVVLPVAAQMESWLTPQAIKGAVYLLAANCHISWHSQ